MTDPWVEQSPAREGAAKRPLAWLLGSDPAERARIGRALAREGLAVHEGEEAAAALPSRPPALAVVALPDGPAVAETLRSRLADRHLPILAVIDADALRGLGAHAASDFVTRPCSDAELRERVRLLLRRTSEREARLRVQERLESAQRLAHSGSFTVALDTGAVEASLPMFELLGLLPRQGQRWSGYAKFLDLQDRETVERALHQCLDEDRPTAFDAHVFRGDGTPRVLRCRLVTRRDLDGEAITLEGSAQDVTEGRRTEERVRSLVYTDELTQLGNRRHLEDRLRLVLRDTQRFGTRAGVLALRLDRFARVNETLGPAAGDALLREAALRLLESIEVEAGIDCGPDEIAVVRRGGGNFALLVPRVSDPQALAALARRALDALGAPFRLESHEVSLGASAGIAVSPDDGTDVDTLLRNADAALQHSRQRGRGDHQFYRASMNASALSRLILEAKLRRALEQDEFVLHYQPQFCLASQAVVGFESVVRWQEPELGLVGPDEFIPIAEETGLIVQLGEWILREACRKLADWRARDICPVPISVNLSPHHFREPGLVARVEEILAETGVPATSLGVEITENVLLHDAEAAIEVLKRLRSAGVQIALDDFGTGYSSLSYLRRLPVDTLKIDRSFVSEIASEEPAAALTASIVAMGNALGLRVVAEGVEDEQQRSLLRAWGCQVAQGFLFGRAVPAREAEELWAESPRDGGAPPDA
ncbi:MAG: EAL domain-containing protein [Myxococcota bacterium]